MKLLSPRPGLPGASMLAVLEWRTLAVQKLKWEAEGWHGSASA
jgi:hypothetical protein